MLVHLKHKPLILKGLNIDSFHCLVVTENERIRKTIFDFEPLHRDGRDGSTFSFTTHSHSQLNKALAFKLAETGTAFIPLLLFIYDLDAPAAA